MNIIFLDIDGVLNDKKYLQSQESGIRKIERDVLFESAQGSKPHLNTIIKYDMLRINMEKLSMVIEVAKNTASGVVMMSNWSEQEYYETFLNDLYELGLPIIGYIDGTTPFRGSLIKKYVNEHDVNNYVIVDGELAIDYSSDLLNNMVLTNYEDGLMDRHISLMYGVLNRYSHRR